MKFLLWFALVAFVVWKIGRDWQRARGVQGRLEARTAAEAAFERILREQAFARLQRALQEAGF